MDSVLATVHFSTEYEDVFRSVACGETGQNGSVMWAYCRDDYYNITPTQTDDGYEIVLSHMTFDQEYTPRLRKIMTVTDTPRGQHVCLEELPHHSIPLEAETAPAFLLQALLSGIQNSVRLRQEEGLIA